MGTRCGWPRGPALAGAGLELRAGLAGRQAARFRGRALACSTRWRRCRWRCRVLPWDWATSCSSTRRGIRCAAGTAGSACWCCARVAHYYSVAHLTQLGALRQLDPEYERVAESLGLPFWTHLRRVHLPLPDPDAGAGGGLLLRQRADDGVRRWCSCLRPTTTLAASARLLSDGRRRRHRAGRRDGDVVVRDRGDLARRMAPAGHVLVQLT